MSNLNVKDKFSFISAIFFTFVVFQPHPVSASDFDSPRTVALGGAGHAGPLLNDTIYLNPSFASFLPTYSVSGNYTTFNGSPVTTPQGVTDYHGRNYNFSVLDGRSDLFQAGVGFTQREDGTFVNVGASKELAKRFGVGLGGKFFFNSASKTSGRDLIYSMTEIPFDWLQTALIADNLLQTSAGKQWNLYREFTLGMKFNVQSIVLVYIDPHLTPDLPTSSEFGYQAGVEFVIMQDVFLRMGHFQNAMTPFSSTYGEGYGVGLGWVAPRISLDYGMSRVLHPHPETSHNFGATIYF